MLRPLALVHHFLRVACYVVLPSRKFEESSIALEVLVEGLRRGEERYDLPVMLDIS